MKHFKTWDKSYMRKLEGPKDLPAFSPSSKEEELLPTHLPL